MNKISLKEKIFSTDNIYAAIYSLGSYINEPNLLSLEDYNLFCTLKDKYNADEINKVIKRCQNTLNELYSTDELFEAEVFFKLKGYKNKKFTFRPIHTCPLITQICLVSMLQPIMFNDGEKRKKSQISNLFPNNFFGNKPSTDCEHLYQRWQTGYKEYSNLIIRKSKEFSENNKYKYEVSLDLEDFFPSVNPAIIIKHLKNKCKNIYSDLKFFEKTLIKLLYFKLNNDNLKGWEKTYYPNFKESDFRDKAWTTRGIPQGLPQAAFFGNIIMTKIADILDKNIPGEALFYVDDSVIFTNISKREYNSFIKSEVYSKILKECTFSSKEIEGDLPTFTPDLLAAKYKQVQHVIPYSIRFHKKGKSYMRPIKETKIANGGLFFLQRQVSMAGPVFFNSDEFEDTSSLAKTRGIKKLIDAYLEDAKNKLKLKKSKAKNGNHLKYLSRIKLLRRHLRFFKFRERALSLKEEGEISVDDIENFKERFIKSNIKTPEEKKKYIENFDEDIFLAEYRLLMNNLSTKAEIQGLQNCIANFEKSISPKASNKHFLYFSKDISSCVEHKYRQDVSYVSLTRIMKNSFGLTAKSAQNIKENKIINFINSLKKKDSEFEYTKELLPTYTKIIAGNSLQFWRRIYNAAVSTIFGVDVSDRLMICKNFNQQTSYIEFRILAYIRNPHCNISNFELFIVNLLTKQPTISDSQPVDMSLFSILNILVNYVRDADHIDNIIQTHRIISSLWKNGSKFLNDYTLHNEEHAICLIRQCVHLCNTIDYLHLKRQDYYPLFLACYLHDISMVIHPNLDDFCKINTETTEVVSKLLTRIPTSRKDPAEQHRYILRAFTAVFDYFEHYVRDNHAHDSAIYIQKDDGKRFSYIDKSVLTIVAEIAKSHGAEAESVYNEKSDARNSLYSIKYMKILIRLADLMDMCCERISYYRIQNMLSAMSPVSRFHWISHLLTEDAKISTEYIITKETPIDQFEIKETIKVNIFLKAASLINHKNNNICKRCILETNNDNYNTNSSMDSIKININSSNKNSKEHCPLTCLWFMKKNKWLHEEIAKLVDYLNIVNAPFLTTTGNVNYLYKTRGEIPIQMLDYIREQL